VLLTWESLTLVSNACTCENGQKADRFARFSNSAV